MNMSALHVAVKSWHDDLYKYRRYHGIQYLNKHKQAAFLMHWITKTKPIFIPLSQTAPAPHPDYSSSKYLTVNETFAVALGFRLIDIDLIEVDSHIVGKFIYDYYYRSINSKQMFLTLELLAELTKFKTNFVEIPVFDLEKYKTSTKANPNDSTMN